MTINVLDKIALDKAAKGKPLNEPRYSSLFNYFINPAGDHGLGDLFISEIIKSIPNEDVRRTFSTDLKYFDLEPEKTLILNEKEGRIDSYLAYDNSNKIICTEVKVLDESAEERQLSKYFRALKDLNKDFLLIFLVPSPESTRCCRKFRDFLKRLDEEDKKNCYLLFWKKSDQDKVNLPDNAIEKSVEIIIEKELEALSEALEEKIEKINSLDSEFSRLFSVKNLLEDLLEHIQNKFAAKDKKGRFINRSDYHENIPKEHKNLYTYLEELIYDPFEELNRSVSPIRSTNTSIGFPFQVNPDSENNTLFRVLTCREYYLNEKKKDEKKADRLIIELDKEVYGDDFVKELYEIFGGIVEIDEDTVHPNGKNDTPVILIEFNNISEDRMDNAKEKLKSFCELCKEEFAKYKEKSAKEAA